MKAEQEAKEYSDHVREVSDAGGARLSQTESDTNRWIKERVAEAQRAAEDAVKRERHAAEADAREQQQQVQDEVGEEIEEAQGEAEAAQETADELVGDATEKMAEARQLAQEAAEAAQAGPRKPTAKRRSWPSRPISRRARPTPR